MYEYFTSLWRKINTSAIQTNIQFIYRIFFKPFIISNYSFFQILELLYFPTELIQIYFINSWRENRVHLSNNNPIVGIWETTLNNIHENRQFYSFLPVISPEKEKKNWTSLHEKPLHEASREIKESMQEQRRNAIGRKRKISNCPNFFLT